jgi:hypothetical protein
MDPFDHWRNANFHNFMVTMTDSREFALIFISKRVKFELNVKFRPNTMPKILEL